MRFSNIFFKELCIICITSRVVSMDTMRKKHFPGNINKFAIVYITGIAAFFIIPLIFPSLNFLSYLTDKQNEFLLLEGGSKVRMRRLEPTFVSFVLFIPYAADMAFLRPHPNEIKSFTYIPAVIEVMLLFFLLSISVLQLLKKIKLQPVVLFLLFFSISIMLLSGFTVPFTGAIVRYRSFVLPLLITPLLCITDLFFWKKKGVFCKF